MRRVCSLGGGGGIGARNDNKGSSNTLINVSCRNSSAGPPPVPDALRKRAIHGSL